jgi:hypothetical protein
MPEMSVTYKVIISLTIAVLKRGEVWGRVLGPRPYALCPMPYALGSPHVTDKGYTYEAIVKKER